VFGSAYDGLFLEPVTIGAKAMPLDVVCPKPSTKFSRIHRLGTPRGRVRRTTITAVVVAIPGRTTRRRGIVCLRVIVW
jgi:hypothetical protein